MKAAVPYYGRIALRLLWIAVQLALIYWMGEKGQFFFYQAF